MRWFSHRRIELADDTTALLIYWRMWWPGPLPRLYTFIIFCVVTQQAATFYAPRVGHINPPPEFELGWDICTMHLTAKFHRPTFNRSDGSYRVDKQTNKQTNRRRWKHPPRSAMLRRWVTTFLAKHVSKRGIIRYTVSQKTSHLWLAITLSYVNGFWYFLAEMLPIQ